MEKQHLHTQRHTPCPQVGGSRPKLSPSFPPLQICFSSCCLQKTAQLAPCLEQIPTKPETKPLILLLSPPHLTNSR